MYINKEYKKTILFNRDLEKKLFGMGLEFTKQNTTEVYEVLAKSRFEAFRAGPAISCSQFSVQFTSFVWPTPFIVESARRKIELKIPIPILRANKASILLLGKIYEAVLDLEHFQHFGVYSRIEHIGGYPRIAHQYLVKHIEFTTRFDICGTKEPHCIFVLHLIFSK